MFDRNDDWLELVLNKGFHMLKHFIAGIELPSWLAPLSMLGLLTVLVKLLPSINKGSILAGIGGYLLLGLLIVNAVALSLFLFLPGKLVTFKSSSAAQAGITLLKLLMMGSLVALKNLLVLTLQVVFDLAMLIIAALTYPPRQSTSHLNPC